jgi:hypothetical protein
MKDNEQLYQYIWELRVALAYCLEVYGKTSKKPPELVQDMENQLARIKKAAIRANDILERTKNVRAPKPRIATHSG